MTEIPRESWTGVAGGTSVRAGAEQLSTGARPDRQHGRCEQRMSQVYNDGRRVPGSVIAPDIFQTGNRD